MTKPLWEKLNHLGYSFHLGTDTGSLFVPVRKRVAGDFDKSCPTGLDAYNHQWSPKADWAKALVKAGRNFHADMYVGTESQPLTLQSLDGFREAHATCPRELPYLSFRAQSFPLAGGILSISLNSGSGEGGGSVYTSASLSWKVGSFELFQHVAVYPEEASLVTTTAITRTLSKYATS